MQSELFPSRGGTAGLVRIETSRSNSQVGFRLSLNYILIKEFQRLKAQEQKVLEWSAKRELTESEVSHSYERNQGKYRSRAHRDAAEICLRGRGVFDECRAFRKDDGAMAEGKFLAQRQCP